MEHDNSGLTLVFINDETGEPWEGLEEVALDPKTSAIALIIIIIIMIVLAVLAKRKEATDAFKEQSKEEKITTISSEHYDNKLNNVLENSHKDPEKD